MTAIKFKNGDRVRINNSSGFSKGSSGTVTDVDQERNIVWVERDNTESSLWFKPVELDLLVSKKPDPEVGSIWTHYNGTVYHVIAIANSLDTRAYPKTVIHQRVSDGTVWTRRADDWHRSYTKAEDEA